MGVCLCFLSFPQLSCCFCNWKRSPDYFVLGFSPLLPIKQLQNRKTNSGNRPQNVINFVKGWAVGPVTGYYYCRRKNPNQLQIPSCLVSVTVANYKWTLCYSFTSFAAQRTDSDQQRQSRSRTEREGRKAKMRFKKMKLWCRERGRHQKSNLLPRCEGTCSHYPVSVEHDMVNERICDLNSLDVSVCSHFHSKPDQGTNAELQLCTRDSETDQQL